VDSFSCWLKGEEEPDPAKGPRVFSLSIDFDDRTASLDSAFAVSDYFGLNATEARRIAAEVGKAVSGWRL
jgi:hypothetical protein